ncbi:hypothetical protein FK178_05915 [Antarcticibacterium arcticum]|uniref:Uncharacterized protein n=1 Tax=Antarcticibacterium arcticum TaxID=2585771 RepID=A0A5B8YKA5_9FLAO|nr:hypothetical protein [Antarcticibacterium arcticum]QED37277.1 hypothetical protein FK178_05915 [Antarcticibacterium arcticum]
MAEIKIEKKKPVWPWILVGLIILGVIFFLVFANEDEDNEYDTDDTELREVNPGDTTGLHSVKEKDTYYI